MRKKALAVLLVAATAVFVLPVPFAGAAVELNLSSGGSSVTIEDGGIGDYNPFPGAVTYIGGVGNFFLNVTTGLSDPATGSTFPHMDLNSIDSSIAGGGTLTIQWTDSWSSSDLKGNTTFVADIGGTLASGANLIYNVRGGDAPAGAILASLSFNQPPNAFSGSVLGLYPTLDAFYLTQEIILTHPGSMASSFDAVVQPVPEPGTMMLLGSGLVGLAGWGRKKFRK